MQHYSVTQWHKLKKLLAYAAEKVPFYRDTFQQLGLTPGDIHTPQDFRALPILDKQTIQQRWSALLSQDYQEEQAVISHTSGSTGVPLTLVKTHGEFILGNRQLLNARFQRGLRLPVRWAVLGGAAHFLERQRTASTRPGIDHLGGLVLSSLDLSEQLVASYVEELERFQPTWLYSSPSVLDYFARLILAQRRSLQLPELQLVEVAGEYLSQEMSDTITTVFNMRPANHYGCQEVWGIGFDCPRGRMHLLAENVYVEILREDGQAADSGEVGRVVVTGLTWRIMPFIRYMLDDFASITEEPCDCGLKTPIITIKQGRTADFIVGHPGKNGSLLFDHIVKGICHANKTSFQQYRIYQRGLHIFEAFIIQDPNSAEASDAARIEEEFTRKTREVLGDSIEVAIRFVEAIPPHRSQKKKSFIVEINSEHTHD